MFHSFLKKKENVMYCNNRNDLLQLSLTLKMSVFTETYTKPHQTFMLELLLQK